MEAINNVQNKTRFTPKFIASVGILSGISIVLMQILEFPIPFMPPFLKFDFSTLPALIGGFAYGPVTGIAIAFIKAALHLLRTDTGGVGELAEPARKRPQRDTDHHADERRAEADRQRTPAAIDDARGHIASESICAEPVSRARGRVSQTHVDRDRAGRCNDGCQQAHCSHGYQHSRCDSQRAVAAHDARLNRGWMASGSKSTTKKIIRHSTPMTRT